MTYEAAIDIACDLYAWGDDAALAVAAGLVAQAGLREEREIPVGRIPEPVEHEWYCRRSLGFWGGAHPGCGTARDHYHAR